MKTFITFETLANSYIELESKPFKASWKDDERRIKKLILRYGQIRIDEITTIELARLYREIAANGRTFEANRTLETIHRIYEVAKNWDVWPLDRKNPASGIKKHREESRERFVSEEELPILWEAFDHLKHNFMPTYFKLLILTGLRRNTLRCLQWSDIDLEKGVIYVRKEIDKMRKAQTIPLSDQALQLISELDRKDPWLFWSKEKNQYGSIHGAHMSYSQVGEYWEKVKLISGMHDLRIHDLRRTTGSYLGQAGVNQELIGKALNHTPGSKATAIYTRFADPHLKKALNEHGRIVDQIVTKGVEKTA